jgi:hypothetical protein
MNLRSLCALLLLAAAGACNLENPGTSPPPGKLAYPIALELSQATTASGASKYLYVANTNYDLRYNGASVQSYDLEALDALIKRYSCRQDIFVPPEDEMDAGEGPLDADVDAGAELDAGDAGPSADAGDAGDAAEDAGDATGDAADAEAPSDGGVEAGDATLIDTVDGGIRDVISAASRRGRLCDNRPSPLDNGALSDPENAEVCCFGASNVLNDLRAGEVFTDSYASGLTMLPTPSGDDEFLYVTLRSRDQLVYLRSDPETGALSCGDDEGRCTRGPGPKTKSEVDPDEEFAPSPAAVTSGPFAALGVVDPSVAKAYRGFVATAHDLGYISLFGVLNSGEPKLLDVVQGTSTRAVSLHVDPGTQFLYAGAVASTSIERVGVREGTVSGVPVPYRAESLALNGLTGTGDVRDVLVDPRPSAPGAPLRAYGLVRGTGNRLQSVAFLELDSRTDDGRFARAIDAVRVGIGPSKLIAAQIGGRMMLFASCYDASEIHVIDADRRQTVTVIRDVLGPFDMRVDDARRLLYVTDFRTSALRVVDLNGLYLHVTAPPPVVATIGVPTNPGSTR